MKAKLRDKRTWVKGILVDCPMGAPMESCPAGSIRSLPLHELVTLVNSLPEKKLDAIISLHEACQNRREKHQGHGARSVS